MAYKETELLSSAARTTSGEGSSVDTTPGGSFVPGPAAAEAARFYLDVTAASGTSPTLDVDIVTTVGGTDYVLGSFTQATATGQQTITVAACPKDVKVEYAIGGTTPSFTFAVHATRL